MRKLFLIVAIIFTTLGAVFAFLPVDTIALAPILLGLVFGVLAFSKSDVSQRKTVTIILGIAFVAAIIVVSKHFLEDDSIIVDPNFEKTKIESQKEAQKTLEEDLE